MRAAFLRKYAWLEVLLLAVLINEYLVYKMYRFFWPAVLISNKSTYKSVKLLFVADPQLQGYEDESQLLGMLTRWDADRYLSNGFANALHHVNPDVIIFLGDLIDEGSRATDEDYKSYVLRFRSIFQQKIARKVTLLPGDNDVGGEGGDRKTTQKMARFLKFFGSYFGYSRLDFLDILNLDYDSRNLYLENSALYMAKIKALQRDRKNAFSMIVNHQNILKSPASYYAPLIETARPNLIISADVHRSFVYQCVQCFQATQRVNGHFVGRQVVGPVGNDITTIQFSLFTQRQEDLYEIVVPTCSYRMGVYKMAYGAMILYENGDALYTNLWLPSRFYCLAIYVLALVVSGISFFFCGLRRRISYSLTF